MVSTIWSIIKALFFSVIFFNILKIIADIVETYFGNELNMFGYGISWFVGFFTYETWYLLVAFVQFKIGYIVFMRLKSFYK